MSAYELPICKAYLVALAICIASPCAWAQLSPGQLTGLSLEELGNIEVMSVSKKPERVADAPASIFVITAEDIRRAGALTIPEALRLAPNLQVAQLNAAGYAITARGMNGSNNSGPNRLLVMIDGRSVYSPLFAGVFWDVQDVPMDDIDRIEVISGPGGTLWGVNAVNGVINVITRSATDRQGTLLTAIAGDDQSETSVRHGGSFGADGHFVAYGKWLARQHTVTGADTPIDDAGHKAQVGFRLDWGATDSRFGLDGNWYRGVGGQPEPGAIAVSGIPFVLGDFELSGGNLTGHWDRELSGGGKLGVQAYFDRTERVVPPTFTEKLDIFDVQLLHSLAPTSKNSIVWGANFRQGRDRIVNGTPYFAFLPARVNQQWISVFGQDEIALTKASTLTVGARFERNDYTGTEFLPGARLAWNVAPNHLLWAAASRAVRAPSRFDRDAFIPATPPFVLDGGSEVRSEVADVYELGYRGQPSRRLTLSATVWHANYDHVRSLEIDPTFTHLFFGSLMEGDGDGLEVWGKVQASAGWRLSFGLTALHEHLRLKPGSNDVTGPEQTGNDPSNTWQLQSSWDIGGNQQFDLGLRHVAELTRTTVPAYTALDLRYGWRARPGLDVSLIGRNLTGSHAEYGVPEFRAELDRSVFIKIEWER